MKVRKKVVYMQRDFFCVLCATKALKQNLTENNEENNNMLSGECCKQKPHHTKALSLDIFKHLCVF